MKEPSTKKWNPAEPWKDLPLSVKVEAATLNYEPVTEKSDTLLRLRRTVQHCAVMSLWVTAAGAGWLGLAYLGALVVTAWPR